MTLQPSFSSRHSPHLPLGSGGWNQRAGNCFRSTGEEDCGRLWPLHRMFTFVIKESEFLRLCVCVELCWRPTHSLSYLFHPQYAAALWEVDSVYMSYSFTCMVEQEHWLQLTCSSAGTAVQQCTPTLTHSPLPLPAPAEGTQGQVSWYKQLLPSVQGRSKGESPYVCAERNSTSFLERTEAGYSHTMTQSPHVQSPTCTHTYTTPTHN